MKTCGILSSLSDLPAGTERVVFAVGVFDGVHLGHRRIFRRLLEMAAERKAAPVALYFEPFPRAVLFPGDAPRRLATVEQRRRLLAECGIPWCLEMEFTRELAALSPEAFLESFFAPGGGTPRTAGFCVGEGWRFGRGNAGTAAFLRDYLERRGAGICVVPPLWHRGEVVSSTRIRAAVAAGDLEDAAAMLGRPVTLAGTVVHGLGKALEALDCPTANLVDGALQYPPSGVYAARVRPWEDGRRLDGIVYIGDAPTVRRDGGGRVVTEIHCLDVREDLYGRRLEVELLEFLRPSRRFAGVPALREQVGRDIARAREVLRRR